MNQPTLSVLMPNYNHGQYIGQALQAILDQTFRPLEIIVVDNCSTDNSVEQVESFAQKETIVRLFKNEYNKGLSYSLDRALSLASGDYVYVAAADDRVLPGFFEKAMEMASQYPDAGIIFGKLLCVDSIGNSLRLAEVPKWQENAFISPNRFLKDYLENELATRSLGGSTIYKRQPLMEVGGFRADVASSDTFAANAIALKHGACYIPEVLMCWRVLPTSVSHTSVRNLNLMLEHGKKTAALMRKSEFQDRFPEVYIRKWEKEYHRLAILVWLSGWLQKLIGTSNYSRLRQALSSLLYQGLKGSFRLF